MSNLTAIKFEADLSEFEAEVDRFMTKLKAQAAEIDRRLDAIEERQRNLSTRILTAERNKL